MKRKSQELRRWLYFLTVLGCLYIVVFKPLSVVHYHLFPQMRPALGQVIPGGRFEAKTPRIEKLCDEFKAEWDKARSVIVPSIEARIEFPDRELYIAGERAIAYTTWDNGFVTRVDWRMVAAIHSVEPKNVKLVAVHEVCHLVDREVLKRDEPLNPNDRMVLEMHANRCVTLYMATQ